VAEEKGVISEMTEDHLGEEIAEEAKIAVQDKDLHEEEKVGHNPAEETAEVVQKGLEKVLVILAEKGVAVQEGLVEVQVILAEGKAEAVQEDSETAQVVLVEKEVAVQEGLVEVQVGLTEKEVAVQGDSETVQVVLVEKEVAVQEGLVEVQVGLTEKEVAVQGNLEEVSENPGKNLKRNSTKKDNKFFLNFSYLITKFILPHKVPQYNKTKW
jgi:hypothetical protein